MEQPAPNEALAKWVICRVMEAIVKYNIVL